MENTFDKHEKKAVQTVRFGPAGNDKLFYDQGYKSSIQAPKWLREEMRLSAFEISCGRGIRMSTETAHKLRDEAKKYDIELSVHAPYFINLANPDALDKNYNYIESSIKLVNEMGGTRIVVHPASQGKLERDVALENTEDSLRTIIARLDASGISNWLICLETMGKYRTIGDYKEVAELCKIDDRLIPTVDFGHLNCLLQGEMKHNENKIPEIMNYLEEHIGIEKLKMLHIHWSAVEYSDKGEVRHTTLDDEKWNFSFLPLARVIKEKGLSPIIICESSEIMAQDAKRLNEIFDS